MISLSLLFLLLATGCDQLFELLDESGGDFDLTVYGLNANYQNGAVELSWNYVEGADSYDILYSLDEYGSYQYLDTVYSNTFYTHYGEFNSNTYYYYKIRVYDYMGNSYDSNSVYVYIDYSSSGSVENFYVQMSGNSAYLSWSQHNDAQQYEIEYKLGYDGTFMYLTTLYNNYSTEYYHDNLNISTYYYYRIRYKDYDGNWSDYSDEIWIYSGDDHGGGTIYNFSVMMSGESVYLSWDQNNDATQYRIEYSNSQYGEYMELTVIYNNYTTSYYHNGVNSYTDYYYKIQYLDGNGTWSDFTDSIWINTGFIGGTPITNFNAVMYGSSSYISWDYHDNAYMYEVEVSNYMDHSFSSVGMIYDYNTPEIYHHNLNPETNYYYRIRYQDYNDNWSEYYGPVSVYSGDLIGEGVIGFSAVNQNGQVYLSWDNHVDADYYQIWESTSYSGPYNFIANSYSTDFTYTEVPLNVTRYYKVNLVDYYGDAGAFSEILSVYTEYIPLSSNNNLTSLYFNTGTLDYSFDNFDYFYVLTVGSGVESVTVTPTVQDGTAEVYVNDVFVTSGTSSEPETLLMGDNSSVFVIDVYAEDGTPRTFTIDVFREPTTDLEDFIVHGAVNVHYDSIEDLYYVGTETGVDSVDLEVIPLAQSALVYIEGYETNYRTITLSGDYTERSLTVEVVPYSGSPDSRFIDVIIVPNWTNDNPGGETELYYSFSAVQFQNYMIQWDDKVNGSGRYGEDILVTALYSDMTTVYSGLDRVNSGFHSPVTITAAENNVIILKVEAVDGGVLEDDFALRVYNETTDVWEEFLVSGDNTIVIE